MKLVKLLVFTICIALAISSNIMRKVTKKSSTYFPIKLAVFRDIGQIDQFEKKVINNKFFLKVIIAAPESKRLEKLQEYFIYDSKEDSKYKESLCSKTDGKDLKKITLTIDNFSKIKQKLADENATEYVLLGNAL